MRLPCLSIAIAALLALGACKPEPPEKEQPPEPQAAAPATRQSDQHTELRDAIQRPIERAEQVEADVEKAAEAQRAAIEAATGG